MPIDLRQHDRRVVHHWHKLIDTPGNLPEVRFIPVDIRKRVPSGGRRVRRNRDDLSGGNRLPEFVQQGQEVRITRRHRLDIEMNTGKPGMIPEKIDHGGDEVRPPAREIR